MMSKISASLILVLAISYVQADGHGYGHHGHHGHHYAHDRDAEPAAYDDYDSAYAPPDPAAAPSGYGSPPADDPAPGYGPPPKDDAPSYGPPADATSYDSPSYGGDKEIPDLTPLIIGLLFIVGLSLLFPWHVRIDSAVPQPAAGRKRRDADEYYEIARTDYIGRSFEIYDHLNAALEPVDRGCIEKITCEVGGLSYDAGLTSNPLLRIVSGFVPGTYGKYYKQFVYPDNCEKIQCGAFP